MLQGHQCLLPGGCRLAEGGTRKRLGSSLPAAEERLIPHLAPHGMVCQTLHLLGHAVGIERLQGADNLGMQQAAPFVQQLPVGHLVRQGMLEGVDQLGKEAGFVEELGGLEVRETAMQYFFGQLGNGLQQGEGHLGADHRRRLEETLVL